jgi:hypothetical protein
VFDKDEKKIYATMLAMPNQRMTPTDKPVVLFSERASGSPQAVKVWYYPGDTIGNEFVYPKSQAMRIARETHTRVLATNDEPKTSANTPGEIPVEMKTAAVGYFDENGNWQSEAEHPVVMSNTPVQTARAETQSAGTSGSRPARTHLPRTASSLALFELLSGLSLAGGFVVGQIRKHVA